MPAETLGAEEYCQIFFLKPLAKASPHYSLADRGTIQFSSTISMAAFLH